MKRIDLTPEDYARDGGPAHHHGRVYELEMEELAALKVSKNRAGGEGGGSEWVFGSAVVGVEPTRRALRAGRVPRSFLEAYDAARGALQPAVESFARVGRTTRRRRRYSEEGDELNIDRLTTGDPLFWERRKRDAKKRVVRLGVQFGYIAGANENTFIRNAALAAAASDALELVGYGVDIVAVSWGDMRGDHQGEEWTLAVPLKTADERLDVQSVLTTGLVGMSRCFEFALWDREEGNENWNMGMQKLSGAARKALSLDALVGQSWDVTENGLAFHDELQGFLSQIEKISKELPIAGALGPEDDMGITMSSALDTLDDMESDALWDGQGEGEEDGEGEGQGAGEGEDEDETEDQADDESGGQDSGQEESQDQVGMSEGDGESTSTQTQDEWVAPFEYPGWAGIL